MKGTPIMVPVNSIACEERKRALAVDRVADVEILDRGLISQPELG
jgi:hypothetical protein